MEVSRLTRADWSEECEGFVIFTMPSPLPGHGGTHNGYILLDEDHPICRRAGVDYDEANDFVSVHGGFTFGEFDVDGKICYGFDTMHYGDTAENCDFLYTKSECRKLAKQCRDIKEGRNPFKKND